MRAKPRFLEPIRAALPKLRVQGTSLFAVTGVDFAGQLIIHSSVLRVVDIKAWVAVFVYFITRVVHMEAVEDFTSKTFIAVLYHFVATLLYYIIYSHNGTNFIGAQTELSS